MHRYQVIKEGKQPELAGKAIILLHGRGGNAEDIITLAEEFCDDTFFIAAPQAPGNAWYPYTFLSPVEKNEPWLSEAINTVKELIGEISVFIPRERIYLMGFSQGACLALEYTARHPEKYAGIAAFSGGLIGDNIIQGNYTGDLAGTKVFIGNSDHDPHIPLERAKESAGVFRQLNGDVTLKIYPGMSHTIINEEIVTVRNLMFDPVKSL